MQLSEHNSSSMYHYFKSSAYPPISGRKILDFQVTDRCSVVLKPFEEHLKFAHYGLTILRCTWQLPWLPKPKTVTSRKPQDQIFGRDSSESAKLRNYRWPHDDLSYLYVYSREPDTSWQLFIQACLLWGLLISVARGADMC